MKRGGANLLAGRAHTYFLYPFTYQELGDAFDLQSALEWGTLPKIASLESLEERKVFLQTYALRLNSHQRWDCIYPYRSFFAENLPKITLQCEAKFKFVNYSLASRM